MNDYEKLFKQIDESLQIKMRRIQLQMVGVSEEDAVVISKYSYLSEQLIHRIKNGYHVGYAIGESRAKARDLDKENYEKDNIIKQLQEENKSLQAELDKTKNTNITINVSCDGLNDNTNYIIEQITKVVKEHTKFGVKL